MFWPLKGLTCQPCWDKRRQRAVVRKDLPALEVVPTTIIAFINKYLIEIGRGYLFSITSS
jgi:hypothetical protein